MAIPIELSEKIDSYERQGNSPEDIINGIANSQTYKKEASKVKEFLGSGYNHEEIFKALKGAKVEASFIGGDPIIDAAAKTIVGLPATAIDAAREAISGATLGLSEKILPKQTPDDQRTVLGEKFISPRELRKTSKSANIGMDAAKLAGEFLPISQAAKVIGSGAKVATKLIDSKWADPLAKIIGWSAAGGVKTAAEHLIKEGELPDANSVSKEAATWGAFEVATSIAGWGGRIAYGINNLAKASGRGRVETFQDILAMDRDKSTGLVPMIQDYNKLYSHLNKTKPEELNLTQFTKEKDTSIDIDPAEIIYSHKKSIEEAKTRIDTLRKEYESSKKTDLYRVAAQQVKEKRDAGQLTTKEYNMAMANLENDHNIAQEIYRKKLILNKEIPGLKQQIKLSEQRIKSLEEPAQGPSTLRELLWKQADAIAKKAWQNIVNKIDEANYNKFLRVAEQNIKDAYAELKTAHQQERISEIKEKLLPDLLKRREAIIKSRQQIEDQKIRGNFGKPYEEEKVRLLDPVRYSVSKEEDGLVRRALSEQLMHDFGKGHLSEKMANAGGRSMGAISWEEKRRLGLITQIEFEAKAILDRPSFTWDAQDKIAIQKWMQEGQATNIGKQNPKAGEVQKDLTEGLIVPEQYGGPRPKTNKLAEKPPETPKAPEPPPTPPEPQKPPVGQKKAVKKEPEERVEVAGTKVARDTEVVLDELNVAAQQIARLKKENLKLQSDANNLGKGSTKGKKALNTVKENEARINDFKKKHDALIKEFSLSARKQKGTTIKAKGDKVEATDGKKAKTISRKEFEDLKKMGLIDPKNMFGGVIGGYDRDENDNIKFNPYGAAVGFGAAMLFLPKFRTKPNFVPQTQAEKNALKVHEVFNGNDAEIVRKYGTTKQKIRDGLSRAITDVSAKSKRMLMESHKVLGRQAVTLRNISAGSNAISAQQYEEVKDKIYTGLSGYMKDILDRMISSKRDIVISGYKPNTVHKGGITSNEYQDYLDSLEKIYGISKDQITDLEKRMVEYFGAHKIQLDQLLENGIISKDAYDALKDLPYSPRRVLHYLDEMDKAISGRAINAPNSGIKELSEGTIEAMETRSQLLLQQSIARTQDLIARNKANLSVLELADELAKTGANNPLVTRAKIVGYTKDGKPKYADAPPNYATLSVMENGKRVDMHVPKEFEKSWVKTDPLINHTFGKMLSWLSLSLPFKAVATGYNPLFWITNMPRDIALVWSGHQYSSVLPIAAGQFAKDFSATFKDVIFKKGAVQDYIKDGGGTEFLTYYGRFAGGLGGGEVTSKIGKVLGYLGETSEIWTRVAHRRRALKNLTEDFQKNNNGMMPNKQEMRKLEYEATNIAREGSIDFSQGGNVIKAIDTIIPYLNASIQGTRVIARNAKEDKWKFAFKMGQLATSSAMVYAWNRAMDPEASKQISDFDRAQNFCMLLPSIPGMTEYTDEKGNVRKRYLKIAKDQPQQIFTTAINALLDYNYEGTIPKREIFIALQNLGVKTSLPPVISAAIALAANKNDFTWADIWTGKKVVDKELEFYPETSEGFKKAGQVLDLSPARMEVALSKVLPYSNPVVSTVGLAMKFATGEIDEKIATGGWNKIVSDTYMKRLIGDTNPTVGQRQEDAEITQKINSKDLVENRTLDTLTRKAFRTNDSNDYDAIDKYIMSQPEDKQAKLVRRYEKEYELKDIPDKETWRRLRSAVPEARAEMLWNRIKDLPPDKQNEMLDTAESISGIFTPDMVKEFNKLSGWK